MQSVTSRSDAGVTQRRHADRLRRACRGLLPVGVIEITLDGLQIANRLHQGVLDHLLRLTSYPELSTELAQYSVPPLWGCPWIKQQSSHYR